MFGSTLTNVIIRATFYKQFVAGESVEACAATLRALRRCGIGGVTVMEVEEGEGAEGGFFPPCTDSGRRRRLHACTPAGEDAQRIQPTLLKMKASGVRAILDYAAAEWGATPAQTEHP